MHSRKLNVLAWPEPGYEPSAAPRHWPQLVFAREDSVGSDERTEPPARILVVEDDFLVAAEIETALSDAGFDVAGVAASADEAVELPQSQKPSRSPASRTSITTSAGFCDCASSTASSAEAATPATSKPASDSAVSISAATR